MSRTTFSESTFVWSGREGILCRQPALEKPFLCATCTTKRGNAINMPSWASYEGGLVYWSESDRSLCIVQPNGIRWVDAAHVVSSAVQGRIGEVASLALFNEKVFLNTRVASRRHAVSWIALEEKAPSSGHLQGALEVKAPHGADSMAVFSEDGSVRVYDQNSNLTSSYRVQVNEDVHWDWCYESKEAKVWLVDSSHLFFYSSEGNRESWRFLTASFLAISSDPASGNILASAFTLSDNLKAKGCWTLFVMNKKRRVNRSRVLTCTSQINHAVMNPPANTSAALRWMRSGKQ